MTYRNKLLNDIGVTIFPTPYGWINTSKLKLSEEFIREFKNEVYWNYICYYQTLSESFIREFTEYVCWKTLCIKQNVSEDFLLEFKNKINWNLYLFSKEVDFLLIKKIIFKTSNITIEEIVTSHLTEMEIEELQRLLNIRNLFYLKS